jgi:heptosyltransferase-1
MQLAAALGTPVVGIFTCTSPTISGPPGDQHELVATGVKCAASYRKRCPHRGKKHLACMEELDVERVWAALCRLMQKNFQQADAA